MLFSRLCTSIASALTRANSIKRVAGIFLQGLQLLRERSVVTAPSRKLSEAKAVVRDIPGTEQDTNVICAQKGKRKNGRERSEVTPPRAGRANRSEGECFKASVWMHKLNGDVARITFQEMMATAGAEPHKA